MQNALVITDANPDLYTAFILHLNEQIDHYRDLAEARRKQNRRVTVQSDVVGNHRYRHSSGCTWAQLAAKYPKLLSLAPAPSAPGTSGPGTSFPAPSAPGTSAPASSAHGTEPVVKPQLIVSAESKAQHAGPLAVALNGLLVKPTDVVDAEKTYQLVGYTSE